MFLRSRLFSAPRVASCGRCVSVRGIRGVPSRSNKLSNSSEGTGGALYKWLSQEIDATRDWRKNADDLQPLRDFLHTTGWKVDYTNDKILIVGNYQTYEEIRILVNVADQQQNEGGEQEDYFKVEVVKDGQATIFHCCAHSNEIEIDQIAITPVDTTNTDEEISIPFSQIEEEGQNLFYRFLEERNIGSEFSAVVSAAFAEHEQVYYEQWAGKLKLFFD